MPELPEVETVRRQLSQLILGEVIAKVEVREKRCWKGGVELCGEIIERVERRGKYLLIYLVSGRGLVIHLRMTGRVVVADAWYETAKHTRVIIRLESGKSLYYWSVRMFGYVQVEERMEESVVRVMDKLGPDPWQMSMVEWEKRLGKTGRKIKDAILDQKLISGVGNIYANDALYLSGIAPMNRANDVSYKEAKKLLTALRKVMKRGLELNGASDNSYVDARGEKGEYQNEFLVYGKTGGECARCEKKLKYIKISGRGTWYCGFCQK